MTLPLIEYDRAIIQIHSFGCNTHVNPFSHIFGVP